MKENEMSIVGKSFSILLIIIAVVRSLMNIFAGNVVNPFAFFITMAGFLLFFTSKVSMFRREIWLCFGTGKTSGKSMSECMANCYRVGYWLMAVGIIVTFS